MPLDSNIVSAAISALVNAVVVTNEKYASGTSNGYKGALDLRAFHTASLVGHFEPQLELLSPSPDDGDPAEVTIDVKTLTGRVKSLHVPHSFTIENLKEEIADDEDLDLPSDQQRIIFGGTQLKEGTLAQYNIPNDATLHVVHGLSGGGGGGGQMYLDTDFLDPAWDFDFTSVNDCDSTFSRGGEVYVRPCGWMRFAIKVLEKYGSDVWLGQTNAPGEWPVSFHGTDRHNGRSMSDDGNATSDNHRFPTGRAIYSTPYVDVAEKYAKEFVKDGVRYKVLVQNRINGSTLKKFGNFWASPSDADLRPYGLCIKPVDRAVKDEVEQRSVELTVMDDTYDTVATAD